MLLKIHTYISTNYFLLLLIDCMNKLKNLGNEQTNFSKIAKNMILAIYKVDYIDFNTYVVLDYIKNRKNKKKIKIGIIAFCYGIPQLVFSHYQGKLYLYVVR